MLEILLYTFSDLLLILNMLLLINITQDNIKSTALSKYIFTLILFLISSALFYSVFFDIYNPVINVILLIISYVRFPIMTKILKGTPITHGVYIIFLISQSCDLIHTLICNIIKLHNNVLEFYLLNFLRILLLIFLLTASNNRKLSNLRATLKIIPKKIYILIALNLLLMGAITSITGYNLSISENISKRIDMTNIFLLVVFLVSAIITISLISNCISKTYYNSINSILEKQIKNQIDHYNQAEILNSDLRRFKHDYTNHMLCLKAMIGSNQNTEALEYIEKINSEISLSVKTFNTGHKIADAILNEKARIHSDISIKFDGHIPDFMDNVDLCIIFANAVDNAIDACVNLNDTNKNINITANYQQGYFILIMKNSVSENCKISGFFPKSTKKDSENHGFGLSNIKRIVDKYEGDMSVEADNGIFTLYIALKSDGR